MDQAAQQPPPPLRWRRIRKPPPPPDQLLHKQQQQQQQQGPTTSFKSRKRFGRELNSDKMMNNSAETAGLVNEEKIEELTTSEAVLSERRKALFEPLEPNVYRKRLSAESLLPLPDFEAASYPKGWLIGKKRKLVNVDVVESMRRIAVQEMNRKDREIDGLNEQLEEDARVLEHLQIQLVEEKRKRTNVERENAMLQDQINMLMDMVQDNDNMADDGTDEP